MVFHGGDFEENLIRMRQIHALDGLISWKDKDHPELKQGAAKWVAELRREDERRFQKVAARLKKRAR
jgi:hypothetical protein